MIKVGVTGGIGSGKTTLCDYLEELGAFVVHADDLAKEIMVSDPALISKIKEVFGEQAYESGSLNRSYLAREAFSKGRVEELNELVHPVLWEKTAELVRSKEADGYPILVYEAAILLNKGRPKWLDAVILVTAAREIRRNRVVQRDNTQASDVDARISKQPDFEELYGLADFIIENNGSVDALKAKTKKIYDALVGQATR